MEEKEFSFKPYIGVAICMFIIVVSAYIWNFNEYKISKKAGDWGTFGDFVGGTLNPTLAFLSFLALLQTIKIQSKELKNSTKELEETRKATRDSAEALKEQSSSIKLQNFENTFFNMLNLHNQLQNNLSLNQLKKHLIQDQEYGEYYVYSILKQPTYIKENSDYNGKKVISKLFEIFEDYIKIKSRQAKNNNIDIRMIYNDFHKEFNEIIGHYFRNIYQILKFIDKQRDEELIDKKFYTNILRAQLSNSELALLLINALSKHGNQKQLPLLIKFEFMEPLPIIKIDNIYLKKATILCIAKTNNLNKTSETNYPKWKIFGKKMEWKSYINRVLKDPIK